MPSKKICRPIIAAKKELLRSHSSTCPPPPPPPPAPTRLTGPSLILITFYFNKISLAAWICTCKSKRDFWEKSTAQQDTTKRHNWMHCWMEKKIDHKVAFLTQHVFNYCKVKSNRLVLSNSMGCFPHCSKQKCPIAWRLTTLAVR